MFNKTEQKDVQIRQLKCDGKIITEHYEIAEALNNHFINIVKTHEKAQIPRSTHYDICSIVILN